MRPFIEKQILINSSFQIVFIIFFLFQKCIREHLCILMNELSVGISVIKESKIWRNITSNSIFGVHFVFYTYADPCFRNQLYPK